MLSLSRTVLAALAAIALTMPVYANPTPATPATATPATATPGKTISEVGGIKVEADATPASPATAAATDTMTKVNLNTATFKELRSVKGMSAAKARAIVSYRKKHGNFQNVGDIQKISAFKKMKDNTRAIIEQQLTVE